MKEELDIAWAAGILEGEGCFFITSDKRRKATKKLAIQCKMTDQDIILRIHDVFASGFIYKCKNQEEHHKQAWVWQVYRQNDVETIIYKVLPYLGIRRSAKAKELLAYIDSRKKPNAG